MLALFGQNPDDASDEARAGALMIVEHMALQSAFVRGIAKMLGGRPQQSTADRVRASRIRR